ncbi:MAG: hypothetical protein ACREQF_05045 [Candidatus Binataceae bacterium]
MTPAIQCEMGALNPQERERRSELARKVLRAVVERRELDRGYAFRIDLSAASLGETGEWVALERLCCPFLDFKIDIGRQNGAVWVNLSGGDGVKEFLRAELHG